MTKRRTILKVGLNKRHFNVKREGVADETKEVMVPASILNIILTSVPLHPSFDIERAFIELKKIMDTEI